MRRTWVAAIAGIGLLAAAAPAAAQEGEPARGSVKVEDHDFDEPSPENEPMVGCAFRIDFFGFAEQSDVPVRLSLQPPSGDEQIAALTVDLADASGNDLSGSLEVDITDELSEVAPATAESYDYKIRIEVVVKETGDDEEPNEVTKSKNFFIDCEAAVLAFEAAQEPDEEVVDPPTDAGQVGGAGDAAPAEVEEVVQPTAVPAGSGGLAVRTLPMTLLVSMLLGAALLLAPAVVGARRRVGRR